MAAAKTKITTPKDENSSMTSGMKSLFAQLKRTTESLQAAATAYNTHYKGIKRVQSIRENVNPTFGMTKAEIKKYKEDQKKKAVAAAARRSWVNTAKKVAPQQQSHVADAFMGSMLGIDPAILQSFGLTGLSKKAISSTFNLGMGIAKRTSKRVSKFAGNAIGAGARLFRSKKENEEVGSAINASEDKTTGILKSLLKVFKKKDKDDKKEKEKEKKSGLFGGGFLGRALLAGIGGVLLAAARPLIKRLLTNMFEDLGMPNLGGAAAEVIADMLPGAVMGFTLTKSVKGALLGAGLSLGYYSIKRIVEDFKNAGTGEIQVDQDKNYLSSAMRGAFLGYVFGGKSLKAALLGAGISTGLTWITNRVDDFKRVAAGEVIAPKMLGPFPEAVAGGIISGALIGSKFGGLPGAAWGAVIGGAAGGIFASVTNFQSRLNHAKKTGEYTENTLTVANIPIDIFNGMLMGGISGFILGGGPIGAIAGALVGGAAGWIYGKIKDSQVKSEATQAQGRELAKTDPRFISQQNTLNQAENLNQTSKEIQSGSDHLKNLAISLYQRGQISTRDHFKYIALSDQFNQTSSTNASHSQKLQDRMNEVIGLFGNYDTNKDGILVGEELKNAKDYLETTGDGTWFTRRFNSKKRALNEIKNEVQDKQQLSITDLPHLESILKERLDLTDLSDINQHSVEQLDALNRVINELETLNRKVEDGQVGKTFQGVMKQHQDAASSNPGTTSDTTTTVEVPGS